MSGGLITRVFVLHVVSVHYSPKHVYSCVLDSDDRCLRVASCILTRLRCNAFSAAANCSKIGSRGNFLQKWFHLSRIVQ